jgi:NAD(P)-dependent dehydrogenase (short-subunit alcohol dehydrogenase family)
MTSTPAETAPAPVPHFPDSARCGGPGRRLLAGRRLLVVGGGQQDYGQPDPPIGIGRAICVLAAREGAHVAVADLDADAARATAEHITGEGGTAFAFTGDASDPAHVERIVHAAAAALDGLDALSINTGIAAGVGLTGTTPADWQRVFEVNVHAHFLALRAALPVIEPGGAITLTSSTAARLVSSTDIPAYTTSKAALSGLCAYAAKEYATRRVRVNIVMPGLIDTSLGRLASRVRPDRDRTPIPLARHGTAWDIAHATTYLLSDTASYITGITLPVDGGLSRIL